jgi:hypothetical protein
MKYGNWLALAVVLAAAPPAAGATRDQEPPDKEMLKMIEFLREMDMIKQMEMMQDIHHVEAVGEQAKSATPQKPAPVKKKETPK